VKSIAKLFRNKFFFSPLIVFLIFGIDRITKSMVLSKVISSVDYSQFKISILPFFNIVFVLNDGVSFGIMSGLNARYIILIITIAISFFIIYMIFTDKNLICQISYCFVFAGAAGNIFDRTYFGGVIDFLDFFIIFNHKQYHWPAFNIADSSIFIGVCIISIIYIKTKSTPKS